MKKVKILLCAALLVLTATACHKSCTCYGYNGSVDEYTQVELDSLGYACTSLEDIDHGLTYSLCEW